MSALAKTDYAPWSLSEAVVTDLAGKGLHLFEERLDPRACAALLAEVRALRRFDESLFLNEAEHAAASPVAGDGASLLERLDAKLSFVERAPQVVEALWSLLGPDYRVLERRLVCALPRRRIPEWIRRRAHGAPVGDLAAYIRPELRDLSYCDGLPFAQDPAGDAEVVTLHVQLHSTGEADAPPHVLEGSHRLGVSEFPHDLKRTGPDSWRYRNGAHGEMYVTERALAGEAGAAALWHGCTLSGVPGEAAEQERISLVYRIARGEARSAGIDAVNGSLAGPL
ncbi:hypothetical protein LJR219_000979 [Phenylobacterium sp. LjRoot219]|uniref:hypothetical protein n=1 Tax=Phenylobacterium sp. LjRoot219 TaxID=3342283 RepID=UPI003ECE3912